MQPTNKETTTEILDHPVADPHTKTLKIGVVISLSIWLVALTFDGLVTTDGSDYPQKGYVCFLLGAIFLPVLGHYTITWLANVAWIFTMGYALEGRSRAKKGKALDPQSGQVTVEKKVYVIDKKYDKKLLRAAIAGVLMSLTVLVPGRIFGENENDAREAIAGVGGIMWITSMVVLLIAVLIYRAQTKKSQTSVSTATL